MMTEKDESLGLLPDIMHGVELRKNQVIVALSESGTSWVLACSNEYKAYDVIQCYETEDNGFGPSDWDKDLAVGVYLVTLKPWSHKDDHTGEYDSGLDVIRIRPLWTVDSLKSEK